MVVSLRRSRAMDGGRVSREHEAARTERPPAPSPALTRSAVLYLRTFRRDFVAPTATAGAKQRRPPFDHPGGPGLLRRSYAMGSGPIRTRNLVPAESTLASATMEPTSKD